ncbi:MAG: T9SS type A sorting domain-containing protein [Opitutaceae bacterium]|nr:T9SS type A sorting domain-containing protein [Cytophagales bacterium]
MKQIFTILLSLSLFNSQAQTFAPAILEVNTSSFKYDYSSVKTNTIKDVKFTIEGLPNETKFSISISENADIAGNNDDHDYCGITTLDSNYVIIGASSGIIANSKGEFTVRFAPADINYSKAKMYYRSDWGSYEFSTCYDAIWQNQGPKVATITIVFQTKVPSTKIINLTGSNVTTVTGIDTEIKSTRHIMAYPNPANEVLYLNFESSVFDTYGNKIFKGVGQFDISTLKSGIYYVKSENLSQRIVKQ